MSDQHRLVRIGLRGRQQCIQIDGLTRLKAICWGSGFEVRGFGGLVQGSRFRVGSGFLVPCRVPGSGLIQGSRLRVASGFPVPALLQVLVAASGFTAIQLVKSR